VHQLHHRSEVRGRPTGSGGGSASIAIQSGWTNGFITNNILFNASAFGILLNDYRDGQAGIGVPHDISRNTIANNTVLFTARDVTGNNNSTGCLAAVAIINGSGVESVDLGHNAYTNNIVVQGAPGSPNCGAAVAYKQQTLTISTGGPPTPGRTTSSSRRPAGRRSPSLQRHGPSRAGRVDWAVWIVGRGVQQQLQANRCCSTGTRPVASPLLFKPAASGRQPAIGAGSRTRLRSSMSWQEDAGSCRRSAPRSSRELDGGPIEKFPHDPLRDFREGELFAAVE
jgi:hypothetical protein